MKGDTLENDWSNVTLVPALRSKIVLDLFTLQDKHNIRALSVKLNLFSLAAKLVRLARQWFALLPISNPRTDIFFIIFDKIHILYMQI